jgi:hypothetical protein
MGWFDSETTTKPWMPGHVKDFQKDIIKDAHSYYNWQTKNPKKIDERSGAYTLPGYAQFSDDTLAAFGGLESLAGANMGGKGMSGHLQGILDNGGFTDRQLRVNQGMEDLLGSDAVNGMINSPDGLTADQRLVADRYRTGMNEAWGTDAAYNSVKDQALKTQQKSLDAMAAKGGRYGGASSQSILAREQGDLGSRMDVSELDKWRARTRADAAGLVDVSQLGVGNRSNAVGQKAALQGQLFNAENAAISNMNNAYSTAQMPSMTMRAVGQERENQEQKRIADEMRIHAEKDPYNRYQKFLGLATGTPTGSTQTTDPSLMQLLTGGGLGVLALGGMMGGWGNNSAATGSYGTGSW